MAECKTQMLAIGHFSDGKKPLPEIIELCKKLGGAIEQVVKLGDFKGKTGTSALIYGNNRIGATTRAYSWIRRAEKGDHRHHQTSGCIGGQ